MKKRKKPITTDFKHLNAMDDKDIDYTDIPELDETFWENAKLVIPKNKKQITLRIDDDIIEWFRHSGKGYQSKINAVLRSYVEAHKQS